LQVTVERSGGFAGLHRSWKVNSNELEPGDARSLQELVERSGLAASDLPDVVQNRGADIFEYTVTVETGQGRHSIKVQAEDTQIPGAIRSLTEWVQARGKQTP
jgi:hypothetical protein